MTGAHCSRPANVRSAGPWDHERKSMGISFDVEGEVIRLAISEEGIRFLLICLSDAFNQKREGDQSERLSEMPNEPMLPAEGQ